MWQIFEHEKRASDMSSRFRMVGRRLHQPPPLPSSSAEKTGNSCERANCESRGLRRRQEATRVIKLFVTPQSNQSSGTLVIRNGGHNHVY
jgi:hypothetical protein